MKKIRIFLTAMTIVAFAYMTTSVFAEEMGKPMVTYHEDVSKWVGKEVKNTQGEDLGTVKDFVKDSEFTWSTSICGGGSAKRRLRFPTVPSPTTKTNNILPVTSARINWPAPLSATTEEEWTHLHCPGGPMLKLFVFEDWD